MLHTLAKYYDLDRYRAEPLFLQKIGVPESVSWEDSKAQGAIIRWIAMPGNDDIDSPGDDRLEEEEPTLDHEFDLSDETYEPYEETKAGKEELVIQKIIEEWLKQRCGVEGGLIFCAECYRFMRLRSENRREESWCTKMVTRPT